MLEGVGLRVEELFISVRTAVLLARSPRSALEVRDF